MVAEARPLPRPSIRSRARVTVLRSYLIEEAMEQHAQWAETNTDALGIYGRGLMAGDHITTHLAGRIALRAQRQHDAARERAGRFEGE